MKHSFDLIEIEINDVSSPSTLLSNNRDRYSLIEWTVLLLTSKINRGRRFALENQDHVACERTEIGLAVYVRYVRCH